MVFLVTGKVMIVFHFARVNKAGTRENVFAIDDQKKIYILPIDPEL